VHLDDRLEVQTVADEPLVDAGDDGISEPNADCDEAMRRAARRSRP
jgi:hypothetical protein